MRLGRGRKSTTCAITGADPSGIGRAAGTDDATGGVPARLVPAEERSVPLDAEAASVVAFHSALARGSVRAASAAAAVRPCPAPARAGDRDPMVAGCLAVSACSYSPSDPCEASHCAAFVHRQTSGADHDVRRQAANPARASPWVDLRASLVELRRQARGCEGDRERRDSARCAPSPAIPRASRARTISSVRRGASL